jgi:PII-like signaling protein
MMTGREEAALLRIYVAEDEHVGRQPLYEALVLKAREMRLAGATVLRGPLGYGHDPHLHTAKILRLSHDLPMVVEIVEDRGKIDTFVEAIRPMIGDTLVTVEKVEVLNGGPFTSAKTATKTG